MDGTIKSWGLSTKMAVFMDKMWKCRNFGLNNSILWCKCGAKTKRKIANPWKSKTCDSKCTRSRDRTGTDCSTGVWDQRVYRFRHPGWLLFSVGIEVLDWNSAPKVWGLQVEECKGIWFFGICKIFGMIYMFTPVCCTVRGKNMADFAFQRTSPG